MIFFITWSIPKWKHSTLSSQAFPPIQEQFKFSICSNSLRIHAHYINPNRVPIYLLFRSNSQYENSIIISNCSRWLQFLSPRKRKQLNSDRINRLEIRDSCYFNCKSVLGRCGMAKNGREYGKHNDTKYCTLQIYLFRYCIVLQIDSNLLMIVGFERSTENGHLACNRKQVPSSMCFNPAYTYLIYIPI